jgi:hypothetical protein
MAFSCPNCQTPLEGTERFCRKCGTSLSPEEMQDAQTRRFAAEPAAPAAPAPVEAPAYYVPPVYGDSPQYAQAPAVAPQYPPLTPPTRKRSRRKIFAIVFLVFAVLCGIGGIAIGTKIYQATSGLSFPEEGGIRWKGENGEVGFSQPKSVDELPDDLKPWYFPDAKIESYVFTADGDNSTKVLVMTSTGSIDDITAYYDEQTAGMTKVSKKSEGGHVRIQFNGGAVEIQEPATSGSPASIVVALGDQGPTNMKDLNEFPAPPAPPIPPPPPAPR